ncbi:MAG: hypothetical protein ABEH43_01015, partial [Flavobacteriales bacterium]
MSKSNSGILDQGNIVDDTYRVRFFIKKGSHAETYRVSDEEGGTYFLKLFYLSHLHPTQLDGEGRVWISKQSEQGISKNGNRD